MQSSSLVQRGLRKLWALYPKKLLASQKCWCLLKNYPAVTPTDALLHQWNTSRWEEYQRWLNHHALQTAADWSVRRQDDLRIQNPPRLSIVTPVYNTESDVLYQCLLSVRMQTYPYWQWILVDDGSTRPETLTMLRSGVCGDPRIQVIFGEKTQGISAATNLAIQQATGDYVAFLDHDDRLSLDALSLIASEIMHDAQIDILYSDRDMLSPEGDRFLHLFKPDWSPETLLSGNYIFHLMCYKRQLLTKLQGLRSEYDGSQDYDLILRASETNPRVKHIPKVLYHWRQHSASVALNVDSKNYAFEAGLKALNAALQRRKILGEAVEIPDFWKGTYQLNLTLPEQNSLQIISLNALQRDGQYAAFITDEITHKNQPAQRYIAIISDAIKPEHHESLLSLTAWLTLDQVGLASGKIIDAQDKLVYIGMDFNQDATLMYPYRGFDQTEPGYKGVCHIARNISAPYPFCVVFRREIWTQLNGFDQSVTGPHALLDFALRAAMRGWRSVVVPQCSLTESGKFFIAEQFRQDQYLFKQRWQTHLAQGDPYYNINLADYSPDMGLAI